MGSKITKIFYSFGIIFLLTGLLLSAVNVPAMAQENTPGTIDEPACHGTVTIQITVDTTGCDALSFNVTVAEVGDSYVDSLQIIVYADPANAGDVQSLSWTTWNLGDGLSPHYGVSKSKSGTVTLKPGSEGKTIKLWAEITNANPSANIGLKDDDSADNDMCYTPSADLSLEPQCPDYTNDLNVWKLFNDGDAAADYTCLGCTVGGGNIPVGPADLLLYGPRVDGSESITVNYGDGLTATGDNSGVTDAEALAMQCYIPQPDLDVELTLYDVDCSFAYFDVTLENTGDADAEGVVVDYTAAGAAVDGLPSPASTNVGTLAAGAVYPDPIQVTVPVSWLSENTSDFIELTAAAMIGVTLMDSSTDKAYNPGNCLDSDLSVDVVTITEGCDEAVFEVTLTNNGDGTAHGVVLYYTPDGANLDGDPTPLSDTVGDIGPHSSVGPYTVTVPVDWANSNDFTLNIKLTADAKIGDEVKATDYDLAYNQEICYTPDPVITLETEDMQSCEAGEVQVCAEFTLNIANLPEGSEVTVGAETFTTNGEHKFQICGDWPGIGLGGSAVSIDIYGEALLDGVFADEATAVVSYDPNDNECELPEGALLLQDPFCYATSEGYRAAWQVESTFELPVDFAWQLNGGAWKVETIPADGMVWLGNFALDVKNTVVVSWDGGTDERSGKILSINCSTPPPPPPPPGPPVPVTAVEAPVVEAGVLIPVTGVDLGVNLGLGFFKNLMVYLGLAFLGLGFVFHGLKKK